MGDRDYQSGRTFMEDLKSRLANRVQLTSDGHKTYFYAVQQTSATTWTMPNCKKFTARNRRANGAIARLICLGAQKREITGNPDPKHIRRHL